MKLTFPSDEQIFTIFSNFFTRVGKVLDFLPSCKIKKKREYKTCSNIFNQYCKTIFVWYILQLFATVYRIIRLQRYTTFIANILLYNS